MKTPMKIFIKNVDKDGCFNGCKKFKDYIMNMERNRTVVLDKLNKEARFLTQIYLRCFKYKSHQIEQWAPSENFKEEYLEFITKEGIESQEDFIKVVTEKIEFAEDSLFNQIIEQEKDNLEFYFEITHCGKEAVNDIIDFLNTFKQKGIEPKIIIKHNAYGFEKEELVNLLDLKDYLQKDFEVAEKIKEEFVEEKANIDEKSALKLQDTFLTDSAVSFERTIEAYKKMEEEIKKIESLNLSTFEKFLYVHDFAAKRIYNVESTGMSSAESRTFVNAMTGDYIVCAGYAAIVEKFCERLGIDCRRIVGYSSTEREPGHAADVVKIVDEKYGINGEYFCDACNDSNYKQYFYAALPLQDIQHIEQSRYFNDVLERYKGEKESKPIPIKAFQQALISLYSKIEGENFNKDKITRRLNISIHASLSKGDNAFSVEYRHRSQIANDIQDGKKLDFEQLKYIFKNLYVKDDLSETILRLLNELDEKRKNRLINTLNKHFKFENLRECISYKCNNKLVIPGIYLLDKTVDKHNVKESINMESDGVEY